MHRWRVGPNWPSSANLQVFVGATISAPPPTELVGMNASPVDRDRQLAREAGIAMLAIALSLAVVAAVACWRYGVFNTVEESPPLPSSVAEAMARMAEQSSAPSPRNATVIPASDPALWRSRTDQADYQSPAEAPSRREFTPPVAAAPVIDPEIADLPSPYEAVAASDYVPRPFPDELEAQPLTIPPATLEDTHQEQPTVASAASVSASDAPPSPQELDAALVSRVEAEVTRRRVAPFVEDERGAARREPVVEDRPPTRLEAPSAYPPKPAASITDNASHLDSQPSTVVAPDDTFWTISMRVYGTADWYKALYHHNRDRFRRPDRLPIGARVATPPAEELRRLYPQLAPLAAG